MGKKKNKENKVGNMKNPFKNLHYTPPEPCPCEDDCPDKKVTVSDRGEQLNKLLEESSESLCLIIEKLQGPSPEDPQCDQGCCGILDVLERAVSKVISIQSQIATVRDLLF